MLDPPEDARVDAAVRTLLEVQAVVAVASLHLSLVCVYVLCLWAGRAHSP